MFMLKNLLISFCVLLWLSGCATTSQNSGELSEQLKDVDTKIASLERSLSKQIADKCTSDNSQLVNDVASAVVKKLPKTKKQTSSNKGAKCSTKSKTVTNEGKLVFGALEKVKLAKEKVDYSARIDTGARYSSLGVYSPKIFERDGKRWVKFALEAEPDARIYEYRVYGTINIKQESDEEAEYRYEIKTDIIVGEKKYRNQIFNLSDRSHLDYKILIGRNFLRDIAVVDVSKTYVLGKNK